MLVAVAFVPAAPVLVPTIASGAATELAEFRAAADAALDVVATTPSDLVVVLGEAPRSAPYPAGAMADLSAWGGTPIRGDGERMPLALSMGAWWLERAGIDRPQVSFGVAHDDPVDRCLAVGDALAERSPRVAAVIVGSGSASRTPKAPGSFDERAEAFDDAVVEAIGNCDVAALTDLDVQLAAELHVDGRAPWLVGAALAGARPIDAGPCTATVHAVADPYGVLYVAASWRWEP